MLEVKTALMNSANPLVDGIDHDSRWGYGAIDGKTFGCKKYGLRCHVSG